jgi:hypothetical protein
MNSIEMNKNVSGFVNFIVSFNHYMLQLHGTSSGALQTSKTDCTVTKLQP